MGNLSGAPEPTLLEKLDGIQTTAVATLAVTSDLQNRLLGGTTATSMRVDFRSGSGSGALLDLTGELYKPEYRGLYIATAGHLFSGVPDGTEVVFQVNQKLVVRSRVIRDGDDSEVCLFRVKDTLAKCIGPINTASLAPILSGTPIYAQGVTAFGPLTSKGDVLGPAGTKELDLLLHSAEYTVDVSDDAVGAAMGTTKSNSRMLANYSSQQMMSGGGVFATMDDKWIGAHICGGSFWRGGRKPASDWSLLRPKYLHSQLIGASSATRYAVFVPATQYLRKLLK